MEEKLKELNHMTETWFIDDLSRTLIRRNCLNSHGQWAIDLYLKKQYKALLKYDISKCLRLRELVNVLEITFALGEYINPFEAKKSKKSKIKNQKK
jgi:hypothetical protein